MDVQEQIQEHIASQPEPKRSEMQTLHNLISGIMPTGKLWFLDGRDSENKVVTNPDIGYGSQTMRYANGESRPFYQVGFSANKNGISVYIIGIPDKKYLAETFGKNIGKASVTSYCIKFKSLKDIDMEVLESALRFGFTAQKEIG